MLIFFKVSAIKNQQNYYVKAIGGSGNYEYLSQNHTVFVIDMNGIISPKSMGKTVKPKLKFFYLK